MLPTVSAMGAWAIGRCVPVPVYRCPVLRALSRLGGPRREGDGVVIACPRAPRVIARPAASRSHSRAGLFRDRERRSAFAIERMRGANARAGVGAAAFVRGHEVFANTCPGGCPRSRCRCSFCARCRLTGASAWRSYRCEPIDAAITRSGVRSARARAQQAVVASGYVGVAARGSADLDAAPRPGRSALRASTERCGHRAQQRGRFALQ